MTIIHWLNPISGSFTNAADWSGGSVPGASDDAILEVGGAAFTVTSKADVTVRSIALLSNATLAITNGTFDARSGTGIHLNSGAIDVSGSGALQIAGQVNNAGAISTTYGGASVTMTANTTLAGGGQIVADGAINAGAAGVTITNVDNTIAGYGALFGQNPSGVTFVNEAAGVVEFSGPDHAYKALDIGQYGGTAANALSIVNDGLIDTGFGPIFINDSNISGSGTINVGLGAVLQTFGGSITGQTLAVTSGGDITFNGTTVDYSGTLDNQGLIELRNGSQPSLNVEGSVSLTGGGRFEFGDPGAVIGGAAGGTLYNVDNILVGITDLGAGQISIVNEAGGQIDGSATIDCGAGTFTNAGTVFGSGMTVVSAVSNTGSIETNSGGPVTFDATVMNDGFIRDSRGSMTFRSSLINNGVLVERRGYMIVEGAISGTGKARIVGGQLEFASAASQSIDFRGSGDLVLDKSLNFSGMISGFGANGGNALDLRDVAYVDSSEATFSGNAHGGVLTVTDGTHTASLQLKGDFLTTQFIAASDGQGGVIVTDATAPSPHAFVSAMAQIAADGGTGGAPAGFLAGVTHSPLLARPAG